MIPRFDFHSDPPATRQDRAEAWAWQQQQDRARGGRAVRSPVPAPDDARCLACGSRLSPPPSRYAPDQRFRACTHCGRTPAQSTALLRRIAA